MFVYSNNFFFYKRTLVKTECTYRSCRIGADHRRGIFNDSDHQGRAQLPRFFQFFGVRFALPQTVLDHVRQYFSDDLHTDKTIIIVIFDERFALRIEYRVSAIGVEKIERQPSVEREKNNNPVIKYVQVFSIHNNNNSNNNRSR